MSTKSPDLIAREAMDNHYGIGTEWEEPNAYGEEGFTRAQAESDIEADDILAIIREAIEADRAQRAEPVHATADDWEVDGFEDESGVWRTLRIVDSSDDVEDPPLVVSLLMSDVEASALADALMTPKAG